MADLDAAFVALENLDEESREAVELAGEIWLEMWHEAIARADKAEFLFGGVYAWASQWGLQFNLVEASEDYDAEHPRPLPNLSARYQALLSDRHATICEPNERP